MEMAYHDLNQREYELTKHISLLQVNPVALLELRTIGECTVTLPEEIFDMDCPGHYFRRIKSYTDLKEKINIPSDKFTLKFKLQIDDNSMKDLWLVLTWGGKSGA